MAAVASLTILIGLFCSSFIHTGSSTVLPESSTAVLTITDDNWKQILSGEWMVKFYAPWCPACRAMERTWADVGAWSKNEDLSIGAVDITRQTALNGRFLISSLPTIYHIRDGQFRIYEGSRDVLDFTSFILEKKWQKLEPVSSWKSPNGPLMGVVSSIYGVSVHLKDLHDKLSGGYGLPQWIVIIMFCVAIISLGLLLGFVMVFLGDWLWPEKEFVAIPIHSALRDQKKHEDDTKEGDTDDDRQTDDAEQKSTEESNSLTDEEEIQKNAKEGVGNEGMKLRQRKTKAEEVTK